MSFPAGTAAREGLAVCHVCHLLVDVNERGCPRCGAHLHLRRVDSLHRAMALLVTGAMMLLIANVLPIMYTDQLGQTIESTIIGGVVLLWELKSYPIAAVIFIASVMVPIAKIGAIGYLCWSISRARRLGPLERTRIYRATEFVGRWSMIDVFVVSIMVALIQLGSLIAFRPGIGAIAFGAAVVLTMLAAEQFDTRLIWDEFEGEAGTDDE